MKSSSVRPFPVRIFHESTLASAASIRSVSDCELISSEKIPTAVPWTNALWRAISRASDVLPILGRAARMMRSAFWRPESFESRSRNPVGAPRNSPVCSWSFSILSQDLGRISLIPTNFFPWPAFDVISIMDCSAWSMISSSSDPSSNPNCVIVSPAAINFRSVDFRATIWA